MLLIGSVGLSRVVTPGTSGEAGAREAVPAQMTRACRDLEDKC